MYGFISNGQLFYSSYNRKGGEYAVFPLEVEIIQASISREFIAVIDSNNHLWISHYDRVNRAMATPSLILPDVQFTNAFCTDHSSTVLVIDINGNIWYLGGLSYKLRASNLTKLTEGINFVDIAIGLGVYMAVDEMGNLYQLKEVRLNEIGDAEHEFVLIKQNIKNVKLNVYFGSCIDFDDNMWVIKTGTNTIPPLENMQRGNFYQVTEGSWVKDVVIGANYYVLAKDGRVLLLDNNNLQKINTEKAHQIEYELVASNIQEISGVSYTMLLDRNGKVYELRSEGPLEITGITAEALANRTNHQVRRRSLMTKSARNIY